MPTFSISGSVGVAGAGATIVLSGAATASTTADGSGNYSFAGLANGTYEITPGLTGRAFSPTNQNEVVNGANITGVNFVTFTPQTPDGPSSTNDFLGTTGSSTSLADINPARVESPRTSVMGTNLGTEIVG